MRKGIRAKLRKAVNWEKRWNRGWASLVSRMERSGLPLEQALGNTVADSGCEMRLRALAARLLRNVCGDTSTFVPLLNECIAGGDARNQELHEVIQSMNCGPGHLTRPEFDTLRSTLRTGTPMQQYWVVNGIAFFDNQRDRRKVRHILIGILEDPVAPAEVRGWAAERLHLHMSQETVRACIRAASDPSPEVRLWAVYTLGVCASAFRETPHPLYRDQVAPVLERALEDTAVVPGWWSVRREAQAHLPSVRGSSADEAQLQAEIQTVLRDPSASLEDKRWASFNDWSSRAGSQQPGENPGGAGG